MALLSWGIAPVATLRSQRKFDPYLSMNGSESPAGIVNEMSSFKLM